MRVVLLVWSLAIAAGCHETKRHAWFTRTRNIYRRPHSRAHVAFFTTSRPTRPYVVMGVLVAQAHSYNNVMYYAQKLGAKMGCDALIAMGTVVVAVGATGSLAGVRVQNEVRGRFSCAVWKAGTGR